MNLLFNEDSRVKIPATIQFMRLGYEYQSLKSGEIDSDTKIFINRFKPAIERINKREFSQEEILILISEIHSSLKNNDLGKEFYNWLIAPNGKVKLVDFEDIKNNDFAVVNELFFGDQHEGSFRPDINLLINGMPLAFLEVKKPNNSGGIQSEFKRMINNRLENIEYKKYFNMLQFVTFSNNMDYEDSDDRVAAEEIKAGSFYTTPNGPNTRFSFFREEKPKIDGFKEISDEQIKFVLKDNKYKETVINQPEFQTNLERNTPCNSFVTSFYSIDRFMFFLQYGLSYIDDTVPEKQIIRYPQYFALQNIIQRLKDGGKSGVIWHTQGSGKTNLAAYANRLIRDYYYKEGITAKFYFVVDRLDLLTQAKGEFKKFGLNVIEVDSKKDFEKELNKTLSTSLSTEAIGEITVVNIQKFGGDMPEAKNDYDANVQRIFIIDEAHRSYKNTGEFFRNLMMVDDDSVLIALTGTPLLNKKERSNLKFGDYIHKYFYDKSIADGYTLRIKKEAIDTTARVEIQKNLELENPEMNKRIIMESDDYIEALGTFIEKDFLNFRLVNSDNTIGGMIVCSSNNQAKKVKEWFDTKSNLVTGLVITDESIPSQMNKQTQIEFKKTLTIDILIVHQMLTTGYSVNRLKKMYLLRNAREHTLLQTISRVNRPYKSPNGNTYQYGYIVDFVDIEEEFDRTIDMYIKELEEELNENGEDESGLGGLVIGPEDIYKKYLTYKADLDSIVDTSNAELFSQELIYFEKDVLFKIKNKLNGIKTCYTEFLLSRATKYAREIDIDKLNKLLRELQNRIDFINLKSQPLDLIGIISNDEVVEIIYEFIKVRIQILDLGKLFNTDSEEVKKIVKTTQAIQKEIKNNKNRNQSELVTLEAFLIQIFEMLDISNLENLAEIDEKLYQALIGVKKINEENDRLSARYDGNYAFVKTYIDLKEKFPEYDKDELEQVVLTVYDSFKNINDKNMIILTGRERFISNVKKNTTPGLLRLRLYKKLNIKEWYNELLSEVYTNIRLFK